MDVDDAVTTLLDLIDQGFAGLDTYDDTRFIIDGPDPYKADGERAVDALGGHLLTTAPPGVPVPYVAALLPQRVRDLLDLDEPGAPRIMVPLASRRVA